jgi:hypothetical protein
MIFRTSTMDAYNTGSTEEMRAPGRRRDVPGVAVSRRRDGRQRADHEVHFDKLLPQRA